MRKLLISLALLALAAGSACKSSKIGAPSSGMRVLFIGNSYLYWHDIPAMVQSMARSSGHELTSVSITGADMALSDHLEREQVINALGQGGWAYVVLQQGPSAVPVNRDSLRLSTETFDYISRRFSPSVKMALFSAWPQQVHFNNFPYAIESYRNAAAAVEGVFMPVASAWLEVWKMNPDIQLYEDGLHSNHNGSYLSALVVYASLLNKSPVGLPYSVNGVTIEESTAAVLQEAAARATGF